MNLDRLGHVGIKVTNLSESVKFYKKLGIDLIQEDEDWAYFSAGRDRLALLGESYSKMDSHFGFIFNSYEKIEELRKDLILKGLNPTEMRDHRNGSSSFYLQDLDGNWVEFLFERT